MGHQGTSPPAVMRHLQLQVEKAEVWRGVGRGEARGSAMGSDEADAWNVAVCFSHPPAQPVPTSVHLERSRRLTGLHQTQKKCRELNTNFRN